MHLNSFIEYLESEPDVKFRCFSEHNGVMMRFYMGRSNEVVCIDTTDEEIDDIFVREHCRQLGIRSPLPA